MYFSFKYVRSAHNQGHSFSGSRNTCMQNTCTHIHPTSARHSDNCGDIAWAYLLHCNFVFQAHYRNNFKPLRNSPSEINATPSYDVMPPRKSKLPNISNNLMSLKKSLNKTLLGKAVNSFTQSPSDNSSRSVAQTGAVHIRCSGLSDDAQSAMQRARSPECKQKLVDISCQHTQKYMFAKSLPRFCPLKGNALWRCAFNWIQITCTYTYL